VKKYLKNLPSAQRPKKSVRKAWKRWLRGQAPVILLYDEHAPGLPVPARALRALDEMLSVPRGWDEVPAGTEHMDGPAVCRMGEPTPTEDDLHAYKPISNKLVREANRAVRALIAHDELYAQHFVTHWHDELLSALPPEVVAEEEANADHLAAVDALSRACAEQLADLRALGLDAVIHFLAVELAGYREEQATGAPN